MAQGWDRQVGVVDRPDQVVLFVTLDKRGRPEAQRWEGERPITVWWRMEEPVPEGLWGELRVGG